MAGKKYDSYQKSLLKLKQLEKMPLITLEKNTSTRGYVDAFLNENGVEMHPEFELATSDMIVQFALRSLGVGNVVRDFAENYLEDGSLFELKFDKQIPKRQICMVTDGGYPLSRVAEKFLEMSGIK